MLKDKETVAGVGEIIVEVRPCIYMGETGHWPGQMPSKEKVGVIAEKAAKGQALSHSVEWVVARSSGRQFANAFGQAGKERDIQNEVFLCRHKAAL